MGERWRTDRLIECETDDGQRVLVFRQIRLGDEHGSRKRYVLGNSQDVMIMADLEMRVLRGDIHLRPRSRI